MPYLKSLLPLFVSIALIGTLASCGEEPPVSIKDGDPVSEIDKSNLDTWIASAKKDVVQQCAARGNSNKESCIRQGNQLVKEQVLSGLIGDAWIVNEATSRKVKISAAEQKQIDKATSDAMAKSQDKSFPKDQVLGRAKAEFLLTKMASTKIKSDNIDLTASQVKEQYQKNKKLFNNPEKRDFIFVATQNQAAGKQVAKRLRNGDDIQSILKDLGASKSQSPVLKGVVEKDVPKQAKFVFDLPKGKIYGAKNIGGTWVVAQVTKISPGGQLSFAEAKPIIEKQGRQQLAVQRLRQEIQDTWRPRTKCGQDYDSSLCSNRSAQAQ